MEGLLREDDCHEVVNQPPRYKWTPERVEKLKELCADGLKAYEIGDALGVSRSAVIGKCSRLGGHLLLVPRSPAGRTRKHTCKPRKLGSRSRLADFLAGFEFNDIPLDEDIPPAQRKTLLELTQHTCRWPVGDPQTPGFFFCGAEPLNSNVYCAHHYLVAHQ
jgi:GcrA cell cycle regulator